MRKFCTLVILVAALWGVARAEAESTPLDKSVTLAVKGESISDIMGIIGTKIGTVIRVDPTIADQKATTFVDNQPARLVIGELSKLFHYNLTYTESKAGRAYHLGTSFNARKKRDETNEQLFAKIHEEIDKQTRNSAGQYAEERAKCEEALKAAVSAGDKQETRIYSERLFGLEASRFYRSLPSAAIQALRNGRTVCYDSRSPEPEWQLDSGMVEALSKNVYQDTGETTIMKQLSGFDRINLQLYPRTTDRSLHYEAEATYILNGQPVCILTHWLPGGGSLWGHKEYTHQLENELPQSVDQPALDKKSRLTASEVAAEAQLPESLKAESTAYATHSDILALLHRKLGIQIVSDYYSRWCYHKISPEATVKELLDAMDPARPSECGNVSFRGWDGNILLMRAQNIDECDDREIPNRILRPLRSRYMAKHFFDLDDLAEIARLTDKQIDGLQYCARYLGIDYMAPDALKSGAFRLISALTKRQRDEALSDGTSVKDFTKEQLDMVCRAQAQDDMQYVYAGYRIVRGIYNRGWRVDKEDETSPGLPVSISLWDTNDDRLHPFSRSVIVPSWRFRCQTKTGYMQGSVPGSVPAAEVLEKCKQRCPEVTEKDIFMENGKRYAIVFRFANGKNRSMGQFSIEERTPLETVLKNGEKPAAKEPNPYLRPLPLPVGEDPIPVAR